MPAYFEMSLEFDRKEIYPTCVSDLYKLLEKVGLKFKEGFLDDKKVSLRGIAEWNQTLLEKNFELGYDEHYSHDYKQIVYECGDFSEVRGFWLNNYPEEHVYTYFIIIPEDDIVVYKKDGDHYRKKEIERLMDIALVLWENPLVKSIQTGLEGDDAYSSTNQLECGKMPLLRPFAILPEKYVEQINKRECNIKHVTEKGILVIRKNRD